MRTLVIGGTGPTGPYIVDGLLARGHETVILHRGVHEVSGHCEVEHIHADTFAAEAISAALTGRRFDVVIATYGRLRLAGEVLAGRCEIFIGVTGMPVYAGYRDPDSVVRRGMRIPTKESDDVVDEDTGSELTKLSYLVHRTEEAIRALHDRGAFAATILRYPQIYGPRQIYPQEWSVVKRIIDKRKQIILSDGGLAIHTRCAARNAAHAVLLAVDHTETAAGQTYNVGDDEQFALHQWVDLVASAMGASIEIVSMPHALARPAWPLFPGNKCAHRLLDTAKIRTELGYADIVSPRDALQETVDWLLMDGLSKDGYHNFRDTFDYATEDQLIGLYQQASKSVKRNIPSLFDEPIDDIAYE
jgi:nucleoside-diphosphate-sugar epimerase